MMVVIMPPGRKNRPCLREAGENRLNQALVLEAGVEALDESVLLQFARRDVMPLDLAFIRPAQDRHARQLGAVVADRQRRA